MSILTYNGQNIEQRDTDGYVNATQLCQANGKLFGHWQSNNSAKAYLEELSSDIGIPISQLVISRKGNSSEFDQGTWVHPLVAIAIGQWISPKFHVWCNKHIKTLIETGSTSVNTNHQSTNQQSSRVLIAKQKIELAETAMEFWQKLGMFDERDRLMLKDYTQNAVYSIEQNYIESAKITQVTISNRVMELGYRADNSVLKKIGMACSREYKKLMGKSPVKHQQYVEGGVREVNSYTTEDLPMIDRIIQNFFGN